MKKSIERLPTVLIANRFRMRRIIGKGSMGAVYEAFDENLDKKVAVKLILTDAIKDKSLIEEAVRLRDEARAIAKVRSPYLVTIIDAGDEPEIGPYIVYELLENSSLAKFLKKSELSEKEVIKKIAKPLLLGLDELHRQGIVHRDIKPDNILQSDEGLFKVGDLGLAHFEGREAKTKTGIVVGTPGYLAPEAFLEDYNDATNLADIYSAAIVVVEAIIGRSPFKGSNPTELVKEQIARPMTTMDLVDLGVSENLAPLLARALSIKKEERPQNAKEFYEDLKKAQRRPQPPQPNAHQAVKAVIPQRGPMLGFIFLCLFGLLLFLALRPYYLPKKVLPNKEKPIDGQKEIHALLLLFKEARPPSPRLLARLYKKGKAFHQRLKKKGSKGQKVWKDTLQILAETAPARLLLQSIAARTSRRHEILAARQARDAALEMRSILIRTKKLKAQHVALESFLFHHRFNCLASAGSKTLAKIIEPSRRFATLIRNKTGDNQYQESHRIVLLLAWANTYARGRHLSCLKDMEKGLSVLAHRPKYEEPVEGIIKELSNNLCEYLYELNNPEFTAIAHAMKSKTREMTFISACDASASAAFRLSATASVTRGFLSEASRTITSKDLVETAQKSTSQKSMNQSLKLLRYAAWAYAGGTLTVNPDPKVREGYSDLLLDIAETRADRELLYVRKEDWGLGFTVKESIARALVEVDTLASQLLETKTEKQKLIHETYLLHTVEEWIEETVDIDRQQGQQIAPVLARIKDEQRPLTHLLRAWYAFFVLGDDNKAEVHSKESINVARQTFSKVKNPSQRTIDSNLVRMFNKICKFRWRLLHHMKNKNPVRLKEAKWVAEFFAPLAKERETPAGHYRVAWSQAVVHRTSAARSLGHGDYLEKNRADLEVIREKSRFGKIAGLAQSLLDHRPAGISEP